jgi:MFS family permease
MTSQGIWNRVSSTVTQYINPRYLIVALVVLSIVGTVITNACINIAIVAMTPPFDENKTVLGSCSVLDSHIQKHEEFEKPSLVEDGNPDRLRDRVYDWNEKQKGVVFSSFFWSYIACHSFSGQIVQKVGGRWLISICLIGSCIITLLVPFSTDFFLLFLFLRIFLGVLHSAIFPAAYDVLFNWVPVNQRTICFALLDVGTNIATVMSYLTSGSLTKIYGWPALFFMPAIIAGVSAVFATLGIRNKPLDSALDEEMSDFAEVSTAKEAIEEIDIFDESKKAPTPFWAIIKNKAVLAAALNRFCGSWNFFIVMSKIPSYLKDIQHEDISENGIINAGMAALAGVSLIINGSVSDVIINRGWLSRTRTRKAFSFCSGTFAAVCMMCIPLAGCNPSTLHIILFLQAFGGGFGAGCDAALPSEMTKNFPAVTFAIVNTIGMSAGFLTPLYAGVILDNVENQWKAWSILYWTSGGFMIFCVVLFQIFGSAERQEFDFVQDVNKPVIPERPRPRKFSHF